MVIDYANGVKLIEKDILFMLARYQHTSVVKPLQIAESLNVSTTWARAILRRLHFQNRVYRVGPYLGYVIAYPIDGAIIEAVQNAQRRLQGGVMAWQVQPMLPVYRGEGHIRRDMARLWRAGQLIRVGGGDSRQGYKAVRSTPILEAVNCAYADKGKITITDLMEYLPARSERTLRYEVAKLVAEGKLRRIGQRQGYTVA